MLNFRFGKFVSLGGEFLRANSEQSYQSHCLVQLHVGILIEEAFYLPSAYPLSNQFPQWFFSQIVVAKYFISSARYCRWYRSIGNSFIATSSRRKTLERPLNPAYFSPKVSLPNCRSTISRAANSQVANLIRLLASRFIRLRTIWRQGTGIPRSAIFSHLFSIYNLSFAFQFLV